VNAAGKPGQRLGWEKREHGPRMAPGCLSAGGSPRGQRGSGREGACGGAGGCQAVSPVLRIPHAGVTRGAMGDSSPGGAGQDSAVPAPEVQATV